MLQLGVNVDHVATVREARYRNAEQDLGLTPEPDPYQAALAAIQGGADSITVHLREDRRHIQDEDAHKIRQQIEVPLNLEMAVTDAMIDFALQVRPDEVCLVPESRQEVTTEGGLDVVNQERRVEAAVDKLSAANIRVSIFIDADLDQIRAAARTDAPVIELHTGKYANARTPQEREEVLNQLIQAAVLARQSALQVNAGHGLNYANLKDFFRVPHLHTLNIGHAIVSRAVFTGMEQAVHEMVRLMEDYDR